MDNLQIFQEADGVAGHAAAIAGEAQVLFGGGFHIHLPDLHIQHPCDIFPHGGDMGGKLRALGDHGHIDIANFEAGFFYLFSHDPE